MSKATIDFADFHVPGEFREPFQNLLHENSGDIVSVTYDMEKHATEDVYQWILIEGSDNGIHQMEDKLRAFFALMMP